MDDDYFMVAYTWRGLSRRIISAAGVLSTVRNLLPEDYQKTQWARSFEQLRPSSAHVCLYLGFKGTW